MSMGNGTNEYRLLRENKPDDRRLVLGADAKEDDWWMNWAGY
jgi:hypothetical protein